MVVLGIRQINDGGIKLLDWAVGKGLCLMNTCFQKRKSQLITFRSSETETMINYVLVNNKCRSNVKYVKEKNQKKIETVEVERVRGEKRVC